MPFIQKFKRIKKHTTRAFTKHFYPNKKNLIVLDNLIGKIDDEIRRKGGSVESLFSKQPKLFITGAFNFYWLLELSATELEGLLGEWKSILQITLGLKIVNNSDIRNKKLVNSKGNKKMPWGTLQEIKDRYRKLGKSRTNSMIIRLKKALKHTKDSHYKSSLYGEYLMQYESIQLAYRNSQKNGTTNITRKKILVAGGLLSVINSSRKIGASVVTIIGSGGVAVPKEVFNIVKNGIKALNNIGGVLAGLGELLVGQEANFQRITARVGIEKNTEKQYEKMMGRVDKGSLREQMLSGPQALRHSASLTHIKLLAARGELEYIQFWLEVWLLDIKTIDKELNKPNFIIAMTAIFSGISSGDSSAKSLLSKTTTPLNDTVMLDKKKYMVISKKLKKKVERLQNLMEPELLRFNNLCSAWDTRQSIAANQSKMAVNGMKFDINRTLALQIKQITLKKNPFDVEEMEKALFARSKKARLKKTGFLQIELNKLRKSMGYEDE